MTIIEKQLAGHPPACPALTHSGPFFSFPSGPSSAAQHLQEVKAPGSPRSQPSAKEKASQCWRREEKDLNDILKTFLKLFIAGEGRRIVINGSSPLSPDGPQRAADIIKVEAQFIPPLGGLNSLESFPIPPFP